MLGKSLWFFAVMCNEKFMKSFVAIGAIGKNCHRNCESFKILQKPHRVPCKIQFKHCSQKITHTIQKDCLHVLHTWCSHSDDYINKVMWSLLQLSLSYGTLTVLWKTAFFPVFLKNNELCLVNLFESLQ